VTAFPIEIV